MKKLLFVLSFTFFSFSYAGTALIIDTANNDPYTYRTLIMLTQELGHKPIYKQVYEVKPEQIKDFDTIIFSIDGGFFSATLQELAQKHKIKHPLLQRIHMIIDEISKLQNKTIMIILPPAGRSAAFLAIVHQLLCRLGTFEKRKVNPELETMAKNSLLHTLQSDLTKSFRYDTALLYAKDKSYDNKNIPTIYDKKTNTIRAAPLPLDKSIFAQNYDLQPTYPLGFYLKNRLTDNQFFIVNASVLRFADIQDSFTYNPVDIKLRQKLLEGVYTLLAEFYQAAQTHTLSKNAKKPKVPESLKPLAYKSTQNTANKERLATVDKNIYDWVLQDGIACGWLNIGAYQENMQQAAEHLLKSGLNMLWLQLTPEWQLSDQALDPDGKEIFFKRVRTFTAALQKKAGELKLPIPKLFVGLEMTGNFAKYPPVDPAKDFYGKPYTKIPNPLDFEHFWKPEVLDVFDRFYAAWQNSIGNGIPLSGVFLDFEMYHAPTQTGQFLATMDFSDTAWNYYMTVTNKPELKNITKVRNRIAYLLQNNLFKQYFQLLQKKATSIGRTIKKHLHQQLPHGIIAAYNINLPHTWFYKGILAGLSSPQKPVILATFNNEFFPHYAWLQQNNIYLYHLPILLLSKLQKKDDFKKITDLSSLHDGIWFNRVSRLEEPKKDDATQWDFGLENSPLDTQTVISLMHKWICSMQQKKTLINSLP